jgi:hypothetical protein
MILPARRREHGHVGIAGSRKSSSVDCYHSYSNSRSQLWTVGFATYAETLHLHCCGCSLQCNGLEPCGRCTTRKLDCSSRGVGRPAEETAESLQEVITSALSLFCIVYLNILPSYQSALAEVHVGGGTGTESDQR